MIGGHESRKDHLAVEARKTTRRISLDVGKDLPKLRESYLDGVCHAAEAADAGAEVDVREFHHVSA
ncbi:MAG: hypothetical protein C7B46_17645 [Sulfobacillus benefaciens]|uniref:Uncharacterized protein n=1 Tax=Sulfobacillus benefaciens TaxID=453960 RepID=A0A2T2X8A0_9FIRM|nr:MAG: hypothetical protein C7B46_17645 [Sulfobacillus benefaciens]